MVEGHLAFAMRSGIAPAPPPARSRESSAARACDILLAQGLILFLGPLMLMIALAIFVTQGGPIFFAHERIGRGGGPFGCLKFRSMVPDAAERLQRLLAADPAAREEWLRDHKLRNDPRITRLGYFLRRTSLDELPQLFNVLAGQMSLVGPRPIVASEACRYGRYFKAYCSVRPGLTGLWQVSGRNDTTYRRRVAIDVLYSRAQGMRLYFWVLAMTLPAVLTSRGSY